MRIVIAGAGNIGYYLTERLVSEGHDIVVIDQRENVLRELTSHFDIRGVLGTASSLDNLVAAGMKSADIFIVATTSDETNLLACLLADALNERVRKICRVHELVTDESGLPPRLSAVVDQFINPDKEASANILRLFELPGAVDVIDFADGQLKIVGVDLSSSDSVIGKPLREFAEMRRDESMLVVAIVRDGSLIVPGGDDVFRNNDVVYVACKPQKVNAIFQILGSEPRSIDKVMIWGTSAVARGVASELVKREVSVKLIAPEEEVAEQLAAQMHNALIIQGDATDPDLLREEVIEEVDLFLAATGHDEDNILSALLAKRFGCRRGAVVVDKVHYLTLAPDIGVDIVVNPRIAAASSILKYVRGSSISSAFSTRDDTAEILEIEIQHNSKIAGKAIKDLPLPKDIIIAAILTEDSVVIPAGMDVISVGDRVVIFAKRSAMPKVEKLLQVHFSLFG